MSSPYSGISVLESLESAVNYNSHIVDLVEKYAKDGSLLDFGAGTGTFARLLNKRGRSVECIEPDIHLRDRLIKEGFQSHASLNNVAQKFSTVYSLNVLEHIENDKEAVESIYQILEPKGVAIIYVPAFMALYSSFDKKLGHHRRYTAESLSALFTNFKIVRCEYVDSLGFFAGLAFKAMDSGSGNVSEKSIRFYDQFAFPISKLLDTGMRHFIGKNVLLVAEKQ